MPKYKIKNGVASGKGTINPYHKAETDLKKKLFAISEYWNLEANTTDRNQQVFWGKERGWTTEMPTNNKKIQIKLKK